MVQVRLKVGLNMQIFLKPFLLLFLFLVMNAIISFSGEHATSQRHPNNWLDGHEGDDDEGGDETELYVQSTPPYLEEC